MSVAVSVFAPPPPVENPLALDGFERVDNRGRPQSVDSARWSDIFPPHRDGIKWIAAQHCRRGKRPEEALQLAISEFYERMFEPAPEAIEHFKSVINPHFSDLSPNCLVSVSKAIVRCAAEHGPAIAMSRHPRLAAWELFEWRPSIENPSCLLSGAPLKELKPNDRATFVTETHRGRFFDLLSFSVDLVVQQVAADASRKTPEPMPDHFFMDPTIDPDNPETYMNEPIIH